jgi:hypothetical protein
MTDQQPYRAEGAYTPSLSTARECFVDGAQGEFLGEDFDRMIAAVRQEEREEATEAENERVSLILHAHRVSADLLWAIRAQGKEQGA